MEGFREVISLGGSCEVAHNIRNHFQTTEAFPFDWWIVPFDGLVKTIEENFVNLLRPENMEIMEQRWAVRCKYYGIVHHHDFLRTSTTGPVIPELVDYAIPILQKKYRMLADRLDAVGASKGRVLFVRGWLDILHPPTTHPKRMPAGTPFPYARLNDAISSRWPGLDYKILFVNYGADHLGHARVDFANVEDRGDIKDWTGSAKGWADVFDGYRIG